MRGSGSVGGVATALNLRPDTRTAFAVASGALPEGRPEAQGGGDSGAWVEGSREAGSTRVGEA